MDAVATTTPTTTTTTTATVVPYAFSQFPTTRTTPFGLLLEPKASSAIVFTASMLAFVFSFAPYPLAVVLMEAIGWSGLAHLATTHSSYVQLRNRSSEQSLLTVCADADDDYVFVLHELRKRFGEETTVTTTSTSTTSPPIPRQITL